MVVSSRGAIGGPRFGDGRYDGNATNTTRVECHKNAEEASGIIFIVAGLSIAANCFIMFLIVSRKALRRWSHGLLFHQAMVDCARAAILMPLGTSILYCRPVNKCSLVETAFLLLVTVSTVNLLTTVLNDAPVLPDDDDDDAIPMLMDSPQCVVFGMFMIWFASITINLGPTFLSGALAANSESYLNKPSCPLIQGPFRHYVLNVLWIFINVLCVLLTMYHLYKLYKDLSRSNLEAVRVASLVTTMISVNQTPTSFDQRILGQGGMSGLTGTTSIQSDSNNQMLHQNNISRNHQGFRGPGNSHHDLAQTHQTPLSESARIKSYIARLEREGIARVKMFIVITIAYLIFWGPLFLVTLFSYADYKTETPSTSHEVTLHVAFVHAFVNPTLFLVLHKGLRKATLDLLCCNFRSSSHPNPSPGGAVSSSLRNNHHQANGNRNHHHNNDLMNNEYVPPPLPPMNEGMGRGGVVGMIENDGRPQRTYMMTETRSETGSKKETTL